MNRHQLSSYDSARAETRKQNDVNMMCYSDALSDSRSAWNVLISTVTILNLSLEQYSRCGVVNPKSTFIFTNATSYELGKEFTAGSTGVACSVSTKHFEVLRCDVVLLPVLCCDKLVVQSVTLQHLFLNTLYTTYIFVCFINIVCVKEKKFE
jgi:hypothetical protein